MKNGTDTIKATKDLDRVWNGDQGNMEDEFFIYDFFTDEENYDGKFPLVVSITTGLISFVVLNGIDPEPFDNSTFNEASVVIGRALCNFSNENIDSEFRGGEWEIINIFSRKYGKEPNLVKPYIESPALMYLWEKTRDYWKNKDCFDDEIVFAFHFVPKYGHVNELLKARKPGYFVSIMFNQLNRLAGYVRRTVEAFVTDVNSFQTGRPKMGFEASYMTQDEIYKFLYQFINKTSDDPIPYNPDYTLLNQICISNRENNDKGYFINNLQTDIITFKSPPFHTIGNTFGYLLSNCRFEFSICQIFKSIKEVEKFLGGIERNQNFGKALGVKTYVEEADIFLESVKHQNATPFLWKFSAIVCGNAGSEFSELSQRFRSYLKNVQGAEPLVEDRRVRQVAELSTVPGNGFCNLRHNIVTSKNGGDAVCVYKLQPGASEGHLLFGDRNGGIYKYNLFDPRLPSWNCAVLGGPGSGKSLMMNLQIISLVGYPSQVYVIDLGNSFGTLFNYLESENPDNVSTLRFEGGNFCFNPLPLVNALRAREKQKREGNYKMSLPDGQVIPCPVEVCKDIFYSFVRILVAPSRELTPEENNGLDKALNGDQGDDGFFTAFEHQCETYVANPIGIPPKPLTQLKKFFRKSAPMLFEALDVWTRGDMGKFFDSGEDSIGDAKALYLELSGLDRNPQLTKPFLAALMGTIWQRITDPACIKEKKIVVIDEAWAFLGDPAFSGVIEMMLRTIRKFNGFVVLSTQTPDDIKKGNNIVLLRTMTRQILYKGFNDLEYFKDHLQMDDHKMKLHASIESNDKVREALVWDQNGNCRIIRVDVPPHLYWFVTSNADDKGLRTSFVRHFGDTVTGVDHLVRACEGKTIGSSAQRLRLVKEYANKAQISLIL